MFIRSWAITDATYGICIMEAMAARMESWYVTLAAHIRSGSMTRLVFTNHSPTVSASTSTISAIPIWISRALLKVRRTREGSPHPIS